MRYWRASFGAIALPVAGARSAYADDIARVRGTIEIVDGSTYVVKTRDGAEQKIALAPSAQVAGVATAPIVTYIAGGTSDLKVGAKVFIVAAKQPDGTLQGRAWRAGRDRVTRPM